MNRTTITTRSRYNFIQFEYFKTKWDNPRPSDLSKGVIPLTTGDRFSPGLQEVLGSGNTTYIHGPDGPLLVGVFEALMEHEANARYHYGDEREAIKRFTELDDFYYCKPERTGTLRWRIWGKQEVSGRWVDLISYVFNLPAMDALATLAKMLGTNIENLQHPTNRYRRDSSAAFRNLTEDVPDQLYLPRFTAGHRCIELVHRHDIHDNAGEVCGSFLEYTVGGKRFCLPATVSEGMLSVGNNPPRACFLNENLLGRYTASTILFFQDARSALSIEKLLGQIQGYDPTRFIVTAHLGDDLKIFPWSHFWGRDVVFIPAASKVDMARVKLYEDFITGAAANSFRVFPGFLLHSPPGVELAQVNENLPSQEAALFRDTMFIDDMKMPLAGAQQIIEKSGSYDEYKAWGQLRGIFKKPNEPVSTASRSEVHTLPPANPSETPDRPQNLGEVELHHFIRPGTSVAVLGAKNAGKTQVALSICAALRKKGAFFSIFRNASIVPCNVAYVDAETLPDEFQANLSQYGLDNDAGFFGLCKHDKGKNYPFDTYSLMNPEFRAGLQEYLLDKGCRYVVLDNLVALMGNRIDYGADVQEVIEWVEQLQDAGICPIIIHHLGDETQGKARGSKIFTFRARTIITLTGKNEILRDSAISEPIKNSAHQEGLTVGLRFDTCKAGAILEGMTFYAHLPFGAAHWEKLGCYGLDGQKIEVPVAEKVIAHPENAQPVTAEDTLEAKLKNLSPDQRKVVQALHAGSAKRADLQKNLDWGEGKTQAVLNELLEKGIACKHGASSSTYYALRTDK